MNNPAPNWKNDRATETIAHEAANFISREASHDSLITVTRATSLKEGDRVIVFITVFPIEAAKSALDFLSRKREDFSDHLKKHTRLGPLPRIDLQLDNTEL